MNDNICWIELAEENTAYLIFADNLRCTHGRVHNLYKAFSQFPQPVLSADQHYRDVMQSADAPLPMWLAELLSVNVAVLIKCPYAETHHAKNFVDLYGNIRQAEEILDALRVDNLDHHSIDEKTRKLLLFGRKLTKHPDTMTAEDIGRLRLQGCSDAEISQVIQATACFAYWTQFINTLGIKLEKESIGKNAQHTENQIKR